MTIVSNTVISDLQKSLVIDLANRLTSSKQCLLFYSAGSALDLYPILFEHLCACSFDFTGLMMAPVDERFDIAANNYLSFKALDVYQQFVQAGTRFVDTAVVSGSLEDVANWYNQWVEGEMRRMRLIKGIMVSVLGMGADGHTAGLFPFPEDECFFMETLYNTARCVVGYDVGKKNQYSKRYTLTVPALQKMDGHWVYVTGEGKKEALKRALDGSGGYAQVPGRIWGVLGNVEVFSDLV